MNYLIIIILYIIYNNVYYVPAKLCCQRNKLSHNVEMNNKGILHLHCLSNYSSINNDSCLNVSVCIDTGLTVERVEIEALSKCYEDGQVMWRLCGGEQCALLPPGRCFISIYVRLLC